MNFKVCVIAIFLSKQVSCVHLYNFVHDLAVQESHEGFIFSDAILWSNNKVVSEVHCAGHCLNDPDCQYFSFYTDGKLNSSTL